MTFDEKETLRVELFNREDILKKDNKELTEYKRKLEVQKVGLVEELEKLKGAKREAMGSLIGKGKYAEAILEPVRLRSELDGLANKTFNAYSGITNESALKEYNGKAQVLKEDIELAEINADLAQVEADNVINDYNNKKNEIRNIDLSISRVNKMIKANTKELSFIKKHIAALEKIDVEEEIVRTK